VAINAAAQNRITRIIKKIPLHSRELLILLSMDRHLLSIDKCMAAVYLMRSMTFLPLPRALVARDARGARVS
jgi:hypothetical protein